MNLNNSEKHLLEPLAASPHTVQDNKNGRVYPCATAKSEPVVLFSLQNYHA